MHSLKRILHERLVLALIRLDGLKFSLPNR